MSPVTVTGVGVTDMTILERDAPARNTPLRTELADAIPPEGDELAGQIRGLVKIGADLGVVLGAYTQAATGERDRSSRGAPCQSDGRSNRSICTS